MRFYSTTTPSGNSSRQRRGSILFLVLISLVVLALICATMLYSTRLEILAAGNATIAIQNRMDTATGLTSATATLPFSASVQSPSSTAVASAESTPRHYRQATASTPRASFAVASAQPRFKFADASDQPRFQFAAATVITTKGGSTGTSAATSTINKKTTTASTLTTSVASGGGITDLSGRLNLTDPCLPFDTLENAVSLGLTSASLSSASASKIARALLDAVSTTTLSSTTLSTAAKSAASNTSGSLISRSESSAFAKRDRKTTSTLAASSRKTTDWESVRKAALRRKQDPGVYIPLESLRARAKLTEAEFNAVASLITTWSASYEVWHDAADYRHVCVPFHKASAAQLFQTLQALYPDASALVLAQYTLNIIDCGSSSRVPTQLKTSDSTFPLLGYKPNPIISQICSDVITGTENGDNGEYLQITNPTSSTISLSGWKVQWYGGTYTFGSVSLAAGAHVVLTDNISTDNAQLAEGIGNFNKIFNVRPLAPNLILEQLGMNLPDAQGAVQLLNADGNLIDYLTYIGGTFQGNSRAFYRTSLFSHTGTISGAVPFTTRLATPSNELDIARWNALKGNTKPCHTVGDLLSVPLGSTETSDPWFPTLGDSFTSATSSSGSVFPNERILDAFTQDKVTGAFDANGMLQIWDPTTTSTLSKTVSRPANPFLTSTLTSTSATVSSSVSVTSSTNPAICGLINMNTASVEVLQSLPGMDAAIAKRVVEYRKKMATQGVTRPFDSISAFMTQSDIWSPLSVSERLTALNKVLPYITCNTVSYQIESSLKSNAATTSKDPSAPQTSTAITIYRDGKWEILDSRTSRQGTKTHQALSGVSINGGTTAGTATQSSSKLGTSKTTK